MISCDQNRLFEDYRGMANQQWVVTDTVSFTIESFPTNAKSYMAIRYNDSYDYHNLYVKYIIRDSDDNIMQEKLINLQLFDSKTGRPQGEGFGNTYTFMQRLSTRKEGTNYQFIQYMRLPQLSGIEAVGLKVEKD